MANHSRSYGEATPASGAGGIVDRRAQIEREQQERAAVRQQEIAAQSSPFSEPEERIRLWEKLHALQLPRSTSHRLLQVIAEQTNLSISQVREEQERRAAFAAGSLSGAST